MILDYAAFAEAFHDFFVNIFPNLKISTENEFDTDFSLIWHGWPGFKCNKQM